MQFFYLLFTGVTLMMNNKSTFNLITHKTASSVFDELPTEEQIKIIQRRIDVYQKHLDNFKRTNKTIGQKE